MLRHHTPRDFTLIRAALLVLAIASVCTLTV